MSAYVCCARGRRGNGTDVTIQYLFLLLPQPFGSAKLRFDASQFYRGNGCGSQNSHARLALDFVQGYDQLVWFAFEFCGRLVVWRNEGDDTLAIRIEIYSEQFIWNHRQSAISPSITRVNWAGGDPEFLDPAADDGIGCEVLNIRPDSLIIVFVLWDHH